MRRALLALSAAGALAAAGCSANAGTSTGTEAQTPSGSTSSSPSAVSVASPVPPSAAPIAPPTVFTGSGSATVAITKPAGTTAVIATITGNQYSHHLGVRALDGSQQHLVESDVPYSGSTLLDGDGGTTTKLYVHAYGPWSITLSDPRTAPVFDHAYNGTGDTVLVYEGKGGTATVSGGAQGTNLQIRAYSSGRPGGYLLSAPAPYNGQIPWPAGTAVITVRASGTWSIAVS